jgi:hypothetical protein
MVKTSNHADDGASSKYLQALKKTLDWLKNLGLPPLPVASAQDPEKYPKLNSKGEIEYEKDGVTPKRLFTGKNPSYLDSNGTPHLICHSRYQKRLPTDKELELWFTHPENGIGTLGGWNNTIWLDFDVKKFDNSQECENAAIEVANQIQTQTESFAFLER